MKFSFEVSLIDRIFRFFLIIVSTALGILQFIFNHKYEYIDWFFVVFMAGIVGYFTNYLAIKMLFQPKQGKVLGWSGLVPKNKRKIATSLGESIQTQLLAPEIIIGYVYERNLIETGTQKLAEWVDSNLQDDKVRSEITNRIIQVFKDKGPDLISQVFDFSEDSLKKIARNPQEIEKYWAFLREKLVDYIQTQENRQKIADTIKRLYLQEVPQLSVTLNTALENYLTTQNVVGQVGITLKNLISFNDEAIRNLLLKFVNDPETYQHFMGMLDEMVSQFQDNLGSPETQELVLKTVEEWVTSASEYARQHLLPGGIERLREYLDDPANWKTIDDMIYRMIDWVKNRTLAFINSEEGREYLERTIEKAIHKINVTELVEEQVMKLDTDELEKMILDNTGGNLVVIQVLGGTLGMIAGLIQVNILFAFPVLSLMGIAWVSAYINKRKYRTIKEVTEAKD